MSLKRISLVIYILFIFHLHHTFPSVSSLPSSVDTNHNTSSHQCLPKARCCQHRRKGSGISCCYQKRRPCWWRRRWRQKPFKGRGTCSSNSYCWRWCWWNTQFKRQLETCGRLVGYIGFSRFIIGLDFRRVEVFVGRLNMCVRFMFGLV